MNQSTEITYSDSAKGVLITRARAMQELRAHGITDDEDVRFALHMSYVDERGLFDAFELLSAIGY